MLDTEVFSDGGGDDGHRFGSEGGRMGRREVASLGLLLFVLKL